MNIPNLFSYATSELSQDAFICWLLAWASPEYEKSDINLNKCAWEFIKSIFDKHGKKIPEIIEKLDVYKQNYNIDVLCVINDEYAILIEDKVATKNHSNQLERYLKTIKNREFMNDKILPIYFKTQEQGDYSQIFKAGYKHYSREDMLLVLESYNADNSILLDYRNHLRNISYKVESYKNRPIGEWEWLSWYGFYSKLQQELDDGNWDYVANPSGGFLGLWWHYHGDDECERYLQLEQDKLCFKIWVNKPENRIRYRSEWYKRIVEKGAEFSLKLTKPRRFGNGNYMTVCVYDGEYRITNTKGIVDINKTVKRLKQAESLLGSF